MEATAQPRFPSDLTPLPTQPWDERPLSLPLDIEECRTALWMAKGNISAAADILKTSSSRLRNFVNGSPRLQAECKEAREQLVDSAEAIVREALEDVKDNARRDQMARFVLTSQIGRQRGFGTGVPALKMTVNGPVIIGWADGSQFGDAPPQASDEPPIIAHDSILEGTALPEQQDDE